MADLQVTGAPVERGEEILTPAALDFIAELHDEFGARRTGLLTARAARRAEIARTGTLDFLPGTAEIRDGDWRVAPAPADFRDRRVEITGPTERKMAINLIEDAATAEIARSPIWQWADNAVVLDTGATVNPELVAELIEAECAALQTEIGAEEFSRGHWASARELFTRSALSDEFVDFLTVPAYDSILAGERR